MDTSPRIYPWKKQRILWLFQAPGFRHGANRMTRGRGDMGTRGRGDTGTRGRGDTGTRRALCPHVRGNKPQGFESLIKICDLMAPDWWAVLVLTTSVSGASLLFASVRLFLTNGLSVDQNPKLNDFMGLKACD